MNLNSCKKSSHKSNLSKANKRYESKTQKDEDLQDNHIDLEISGRVVG